MTVLRALLILAAATLFAMGPARAACSSKPKPIKGGALLATMGYWPRAGQTDTLYQSLRADDEMLARHGLRRYALYRSSGGDGPPIVWTILFRNEKAHDAWLDAAGKIHETPAEMANDRRMQSASARMVHSHYLLRDGWMMAPCS